MLSLTLCATSASLAYPTWSYCSATRRDADGLWTVPYVECLVRRWQSSLGPRVSWREAARGGSVRQELGRDAGGGGDGLGLHLARGRALCQAGEHGPAAALARRRHRQPHPQDQDRDVRPAPGVAATRGDRLRTRPAP